jgi:transposase
VRTPRFTPEFKEEAVKQVTEQGYPVANVGARLGGSAHSLCKWVKAVTPDESEQQSKELLEAKVKILRLRAQMRRIEEERDLLKRPRGTLPRSPSEVPLHERSPPRVRHHPRLPSSQSGASRLLPVATRA